MSVNALSAARALAAKAAARELERNWDAAFQLYLDAARAYLNVAHSAVPAIKQLAKVEANKALERAEKIKRVKVDLQPVAKDLLAPDEQTYILQNAGRINGLVFALWDEAQFNLSNASDADVQPAISGGHAVSTQWEAIPDARMHSPDLLPLDVLQTVVSNCSVVASLAVAVNHHRRFGSKLVLSSLFPHDDHGLPTLSTAGKHALKIFLNGAWRCVLIDHLLPVSPSTGSLIGASTGAKRIVWPSLVEKAYMKAMGGYDFEGSNSCIDLHALLGWIPEHVRLNSPGLREAPTLERLAAGFLSGQCLVTFGTGEVRPSLDWLIASHDYAMVDIREDGELTLIDPLVVDGDNASRVHDIAWPDVCVHFESLYISWDPKMFPHYTLIHGAWTGSTHNASKSMLNQQVRLTVEASEDGEDDDLWILLSRHITCKRGPTTFVSVHALQQDSFSSSRDTTHLHGAYTDSPHSLAKIKLSRKQAQNYVVVASRHVIETDATFAKTEDASFSLSIYSSRSFSVAHTPPNLLHSKQVEGAFTTKTAGGSSLHPTYMNNPQWALRFDPKLKATASGKRVALRLSVEGSKDLSFAIQLAWGTGKRVFDLSEGDVVMHSGTYHYGIAYVEKDVQIADYTIIVSSFNAKELGPFTLTVESSAAFTLDSIPQEGSAMYNNVLRGYWTEATAGGSPSSGRYHLNPIFDLHIPSTITVIIRLQLLTWVPNAALNITLFICEESTQKLGRQLATSGPYAERVSGALIAEATLDAGKYCLVPSTYIPGICADFRLVVYSTKGGVKVAPRV